MQSELKNQTLVAAEIAKQFGFENTYEALIEVIKAIERDEVELTSKLLISRT